jgi:hypothetical protein
LIRYLLQQAHLLSLWTDFKKSSNLVGCFSLHGSATARAIDFKTLP